MTLTLLLVRLLNLYSGIIIARALISWFIRDPTNPIVRILDVLTEPVLAPIRKLVSPETFGGLDISPILALVAIQLLRNLLIGSIY